MQNTQLLEGQLDHPQVLALLQQHLDEARSTSPPESVHALDTTELQQSEVSFYTLWEKDELLGFAALKQLDATHGELKSMRTASEHQRRGVASQLLTHVFSEARRYGLQRISLETGSMSEYAAAREFYSRHGFSECEPFADYKLDHHSRYMTRTL